MAAARPKSVSLDVEWNNWDDKAMKGRYEAFAKFGNATATEITGKNLDKWLKDAGVLDGKGITTTMTGIAFSKVAGKKKTVKYPEAKQILVHVASDRAMKSKKEVQAELDAITEKLAQLEGPSLSGITKPGASSVVDRLTDTSKYTGSHKERFDDTGKGKGKAGRENLDGKDGYVAGYKNKDAYEKQH